MSRYDLAFAWSWPYDSDFAQSLFRSCVSQDLHLLDITPETYAKYQESIQNGEIEICSFFDRASDTDDRFIPLAQWAERQNIFYFNRLWLARRSWNKATMHNQFTLSGLDAPYTIILPTFQENPAVPFLDLNTFGDKFVLKPAYGGGGKGVIFGIDSWEQVIQARSQNPGDQYLLQSVVTPKQLNGRPAWYRIIYCLGQIYSCWWHPLTHIYTPISELDFQYFGLNPLVEIPHKIAGLTHLELFSTEIALTDLGRFLVVDYINDPIDLRPQSKFRQGVPDLILDSIAATIANFVFNYCK